MLDEIRLDIEENVDKVDENSSDDNKHLQAILRQIGESAAVKAKQAYDMENDYYRENQ